MGPAAPQLSSPACGGGFFPLSQQPQHHSIHHTGCCAVDVHWTNDGEHLGPTPVLPRLRQVRTRLFDAFSTVEKLNGKYSNF